MSYKKFVAVIPLRLGAPRKNRMAAHLSPPERERLADQLFAHVAAMVAAHPRVVRTIILSPAQPPENEYDWRKDSGRGLNVELESLRVELPADDLLVVHADLPLLTGEDLTAMIDAAEETGIAVAPDHTETGTNSVAIKAGRRFPFAFGNGSLAAHLTACGGNARLVRRMGLALDIDCPGDLDLAEQQGFVRDRR